MKHRFKPAFYEAIIAYSKAKDLDVKTTCLKVNFKREELSGLVSVQGALAILCNEIGLPVGILR